MTMEFKQNLNIKKTEKNVSNMWWEKTVFINV